ncbi:MAG: hypothetical protein DCC71_10965 [Proteobacteria bacterium]|nr:MAG: hypothetical protein DCC71_10965 [Pseudomonadota bacterium]
MARAAAGFDLVATACLLPGLETRLLAALAEADAALGLATPSPPLAPIGLLLANLAGALGVLWAWVRIARPWRELVAADAAARCAVAAILVGAIELRGVTPVLYAFVATELLGAAAQAWALPRLPRRS